MSTDAQIIAALVAVITSLGGVISFMLHDHAQKADDRADKADLREERLLEPMSTAIIEMSVTIKAVYETNRALADWVVAETARREVRRLNELAQGHP